MGCLAAAPASALGATFTVDSTLDVDDGGAPNNGCEATGGDECTLREAILVANGGAFADVIAFDIPGAGPHTIQPTSALPTSLNGTQIDGRTEPGYAGAPVVELDGTLAGAGVSGLRITGNGGGIYGLVINRFSDDGIQSTAGSVTFDRNYIGTDVTGTLDRGNASIGIEVTDGFQNLIGGTAATSGNVISGNDFAGVRFDDPLDGNGANNQVMGNLIGTDITGTQPLGNTNSGVIASLGSNGDVTIGNFGADASNVIAFNGIGGGVVATGAYTLIRENRIFANAGLGIDLMGDGVTPNDLGDADLGPNDLINTPVVATAIDDGSQLHIGAEADLPLSTTPFVRARFYANDACDPSGSGEGERYLGLLLASFEGDESGGQWSIAGTLPSAGVAPGDRLTAVLENDGVGSSEFSACVEVSAPPQVSESVTAGEASGSVRYKPPGSNAFVELTGQETLEDGTVFDATDGVVRIVSEVPDPTGTDPPSGLREADFSRGYFKLTQDAKPPYTTEARLVKGRPCPRKGKRAALQRKLRIVAKGRHRSRGRRGAGTVRGTEWVTKDKCKGTLFKVAEGQIKVKDFGTRQRVLVDAGENYLARGGRR